MTHPDSRLGPLFPEGDNHELYCLGKNLDCVAEQVSRDARNVEDNEGAAHKVFALRQIAKQITEALEGLGEGIPQ